VSVLRDRLREVIKPSAASVRLKPDTTAPVVPVASGFGRKVLPLDDIERVLDGEWHDRCFVVERHLPPSSSCGRTKIGDLAARLEASVHEAPLVCGGAPARPPFLFFDLETTGLSGGAGTQAFLVGSGWFEADGGFRTRQHLLARPGDEHAMLNAVAEDLRQAGALVSFNGKSFDAPVLETRYLFHRLEWIASAQPHIDVLHPARRFWKEDECSLTVLEQQVLGSWREGDVAGFEIPSRYFQFLRSGDARLLVDVLEHNRRDLVALAGLTSRLLEIVAGGPDYAENAREALALGHVYARSRDSSRAIAAFERAITLGAKKTGRRAAELRTDALRSLALAYRRTRQYDDAARCWIALIESGCADSVEREAIEALAIHHEHRARDLASARVFAVENVTRASSRVAPAQVAEAAQRRLARIERKIGEADRLGELPV
jgi:tetratricopeptide (TPR) repeat protein